MIKTFSSTFETWSWKTESRQKPTPWSIQHFRRRFHLIHWNIIFSHAIFTGNRRALRFVMYVADSHRNIFCKPTPHEAQLGSEPFQLITIQQRITAKLAGKEGTRVRRECMWCVVHEHARQKKHTFHVTAFNKSHAGAARQRFRCRPTIAQPCTSSQPSRPPTFRGGAKL